MANCSPPQAAAFVSFRTTPLGADTWAASFILSERGAGRKRWQEWEPLSPLFPRAGSRASCVSSPQNTLQYQSAFPFEQESAGKKGICIFLSFLCLLLLVAPARSEDALDSARHPQGLGGCCRSIPRAPSGCCPITALPDEPYLERPIPKAGSPQVHELPNLFFFISLFLARLLLMQNLRCARGRRRNECESRKTSDLSGDPY